MIKWPTELHNFDMHRQQYEIRIVTSIIIDKKENSLVAKFYGSKICSV